MIFIWSSHGNGGPLQHAVMLILFLVQLLPFLLNDANFEHTSTELHSGNRITRSTATFSYSASYTISTDTGIPWKTLALTFLVFSIVIIALLVVKFNQYRAWIQSRYEAQERQRALEMWQEPQQPPARNMLQDDYYDRSSRNWLIMVFVFGLVSGIFIWGAFFNNMDDDLSQKLSDVALFVGSIVQFGGFVWMMTRSFADVAPRENPARLASIVAKIRELPVEEYVPNNEEAYAELKIAQLKYMLQNRGDFADYLEKKDMVSTLCHKRKCDETCCICYEDYQTKEKQIMLRILPKCGHEFHLECLDQWAYTFERKSEAPCCPLCQTEF